MEFRILGPIEVLVDGEPVPIGGAKERALLARLVLVPNRLVSVSRLVEDLWADAGPADAPAALQVHVCRVRRALRSVDAQHVLQSRAGGYLMAAPAEAVDAARFEALSARARHAAGQADFAGAGALWRDALALWRGPAFATAAGAPFTAIEGGRLEEARLGAVEGRVAADLAAGIDGRVIGELEALTRTYPLREGLWALRMLALYRAGRQAEALRAYQDLRNVLGQMGLEPGVPLRHLETAILRQAPELLVSGFDPMAFDRAPAQPRRATAAVPAPTGATSPVGTALVGRDRERAALEAWLDTAVGGTGAVVLISGEPGVGKTRLAEQLAAEAARRGLSVLTGHCYEASGAAPYVALVEILESALAAAPSPQAWRHFLGDEAPEIAKLVPKLRQCCPDIPPALEVPAEQERRLLFTSILAVLERAARQVPVVLVFDDLHWTDEPTRLWIEQLSQRVASWPVLVVATYRDNEVDAGRPLAGTLEALRRRGAPWMSLGLLGRDETAQLLESLSGQAPPPEFVEAVFSATEGNPFFVQEVARDLADEGRLFDADGDFRTDLTVEEIDVPAGVRLVVGRRLSRLGPGTVPVLTAAAVVGRAFSVEVLEALDGTGRDDALDAIEDAERAQLIVPAPDASGEDRFIFAHELIRQTLLGDVSLTRRRRLHARVADALKRRSEARPGPHCAAIAHHLVEAGPAAKPDECIRFLVEAGRFAMDSAAFEEALQHYDRAHALADAGAPAEAELLSELGAARTSVGSLDAAVDAWRQSVDAFERLGDAEAMGRVCSLACNNLLFLGRWEDDIAIGQRGLAALGERATPTKGRLLGQTAAPLAYVGHYQAANDMVDEALRLADDLGDDVLLGEALWAQQIVRMAHMDLATMLDAGSRAVELFRSAGHVWHVADVAGYMAYSLTFLGRFDDCRAHTAEFMPLAERLGNQTAFQQQFRMAGLVDVFSRGDIGRLEELGHADRQASEATGMPWASGWAWLGWARFLRGDWDGALPLLREAAQREPPGAIQGWNSTLFLDALAYLGEKDEALAFLDTRLLPRPTEPESRTWGAACVAVAAVEGLAVLGQRDRAAELYPSLLELLRHTGVMCTGYDDGRLTERAAGIGAHAARQWDAAEVHYENALRQSAELPHRIEEAHTRRWYGQMLLERAAPGDQQRAAETLAAAMRDYERMGMPRHREITNALLAGR